MRPSRELIATLSALVWTVAGICRASAAARHGERVLTGAHVARDMLRSRKRRRADRTLVVTSHRGERDGAGRTERGRAGGTWTTTSTESGMVRDGAGRAGQARQ